MRQALEDLIEVVEAAINAGDWKVDGACDPTLALIRAKEALAQPEQDDGMCRACENDLCTAKQGCVALDNPPPQRTWVGLTDEDISEIVRGTHNTGSFVRAIEAKLKEKNT